MYRTCSDLDQWVFSENVL